MSAVAPDPLVYTVRARNTATTSDNKIHDDEVAASLGFAGGLVPGVDVFAYVTHVPVERWGIEWLEHGTMTARFVKPVYDGDEVRVTGALDDEGTTIDLALHDPAGDLCASAVATMRRAGEPPPNGGDIEQVAPPGDRPPASPEALRPGTTLGAIEAGFRAERALEYLDDIGETAMVYRDRRVAHPGWLLRLANGILVANVTLGPWIHVSSDVRWRAVVHDGDRVEARARVTAEYERKGHRFVVLDVALAANGRPVQRIAHTAIYQLRRPGRP